MNLERFQNIAHEALRGLVFMLASCLLMSAIFMVLVPGTAFATAFHVCVVFSLLHRVAAFRIEMENKWHLEKLFKEENEKPSSNDKKDET